MNRRSLAPKSFPVYDGAVQKSGASPSKVVGVVGCGDWGLNHVRNFYELGALSMVWGLRPE
jgi:hypothetical protein